MESRVIVDAMGGDNAPVETVKGAVEAVNEFGAHIILVGVEDVIKEEFDINSFDIIKKLYEKNLIRRKSLTLKR